MSLSSSILSNPISSSNSSMLLHSITRQQSNSFPNTQSIVDYPIPENRLYERPDGSIGLAEKPIGYVIGEQILSPTIDLIGSCSKRIFGFVKNGFSYLSISLSDAYHFQILPGASAQKFPSEQCGNSESSAMVPVKLRVVGIPRNVGQLEEFYNRPEVNALKNQLLQGGSYRLGDVIDFMQTGASALNIAYLSVSRTGNTQRLVEARYDYTNLVSTTASSFINMQTNNIKVIQYHIDANDFLSIGRVSEALDTLKKSKGFADANIKECKLLENKANNIHYSITSLGKEFVGLADQITKDVKDKSSLRQQLIDTKNKIKELEEKILNSISESNTADKNQKLARVSEYFTLGVFGLLGGKTDYGLEKQKIEEDRKNYYKLKNQEQNLENEIINKIKKVSNRLNSNIGNFDSNELAANALSMAMMGIDEVRLGLESYQQFMANVLSYTDIAIQNLESAINFGGSLNKESIKIFEEKFSYSGNYWLGIGALGSVAEKSLKLVHEDVCERLRIKEVDFSKHLGIAQKEITELNKALDKRSKTREIRNNLGKLIAADSKAAEQIARDTLPENLAIEPAGF